MATGVGPAIATAASYIIGVNIQIVEVHYFVSSFVSKRSCIRYVYHRFMGVGKIMEILLQGIHFVDCFPAMVSQVIISFASFEESLADKFGT